ncbi:hypothetical protein [Pseudoalteromonas sp. T1lg76]|uniref:hypothetical protein n=1 Tax=Pseudoalteromonas sp. T1lg76 TaxID=2077103 RepID=UPI000CF60666|nr:hypothetical protein [Pseudoalteromonas sp. T1lg76]
MKKSNKIIILALFSYILAAFIDSYFLYAHDKESITFLPHTLFISFCCFAWCKYHGAENSITHPGYFPLFCALIGFIGIPAYGYSKFGFKRGSKIFAGFLACLFATMLLLGAVDFGVKAAYT